MLERLRSRRRVLFLGHDAHRGGAQLWLLHFLRWLRARDFAELRLVLLHGGELEETYRALLPTTVLDGPAPSLLRRALRRAFAAAPGVVYANTVVTLDFLPRLVDRHRCPAICHVHELETTLRVRCGAETFRRARPYVRSFIAASRAVADNLVENHGVRPERIHQIYEAIPLPRRRREAVAAAGAARRAELGIPREAFVVGGCGTLDWRKGADVFLQVARLAKGDARPLHFVWVGGAPAALEELRYDVGRLGLGDRVRFVGAQRDPSDHFAMLDAFLLTSREDPFPLAALEAAALQLPIVCFAGAGGMPELVEEDAGVVVPYLDVDAAARSLVALAACEERRAALGARAAEKVRAGHDIEVVAGRIAALLDEQLRPG